MRLINVDKLCEDLLNRWSIADTRKEELIRQVMADVVTPIVISQPTIDPQKWIPCSSERLPKTEVLCCDKRGEMIIGMPYKDEESNTEFSAESDTEYMIDCVAWMPLPEPWKE